MFSRRSSSWTSRCTYGLSLSASPPAPALAALFFAAIELPRLACGCWREHTRTAPALCTRCPPRRLKRQLEDLIAGLDEAELDLLEQVRWEVLEVGFVELRRDHQRDAVALCRERLLL